ncbi:tetratricopeptide repeat protein [Rufibacter sp. DG15C]|uniref:tetratricopeptide repeat protein n=1 Tax=Rufibacter sp. DG15C TaxID=1379909 RepID=UPI000B1924C6|nr:tetratricopeptide repeat protein [Rufibacter sp. DG15C]
MQKLRVLYLLLCALTLSFNAHATTGGEVAKNLALSKERVKEITLHIKQNPSDAQAFASRGIVKMELGDAFGAIKDFNTSLRLVPQQAEVLQKRGQAFLQIGAFKEAAQDITDALAITSTYGLVYDRAVLKYHQDDYFGALKDLQEVLTVSPMHSKALYNRAIIYMELNKTQEAIADLESFLKLIPNDANALHALGLAQTELARRVASK